MLDPLIADLLACIEDTHAATGYERDPARFCELQGIAYTTGPRSLSRVSRHGDGPDLIIVSHEDYGSRDLFTIAHELAHVIAKREGYIRLIRHHHQVHDQRRHIELLMNEAGSRLLMPAPDLEAAARAYGDTPRAITHLMALSGASESAAMRRWVRQDFSEPRAAAVIQGGYVADVTRWRARMPLHRWDRVPDVALEHPDLTLHGLGNGRVLATVAG